MQLFSLGGYHFQTDAAWRRNTDREDSISNVFLQFELSPKTSIQAEYRFVHQEQGDIQQRFFTDNYFFPGQRIKAEKNTVRLGVRHSFTPDSILLASTIYQDRLSLLREGEPIDVPPFVTQYTTRRPETTFSQELQHLFRSKYVNLVTGTGLVNINGRLDGDFRTVPPFPLPSVRFRTSLNLVHNNVYAYSYIRPIKNLTLTLGLSGDFTHGDAPDTEGKQLANPKAGITWSPFPNTTLRAAAFRTFKRTLVTNQTLEPTQVAGFNQFFDDYNGTEAWRYGFAIDHKFTPKLFGGTEISKRDLRVTFFNGSTGQTFTHPWKERLVRNYLFYTPHPWLALRAEYQFERTNRASALTDGVREMNTHRVPLGVSFFHPSGLSLFWSGTYVNQAGEFDAAGAPFTRKSGSNQFFVVDMGIRYRLPKRYGFLTFGVTNLTDKDFKYYNLDLNNPGGLQPGRTVFGQITLALP